MTDQTTACRPDDCLAEDWLDFLGHRWNALLLWHLSAGPKRYSELQGLMPRISPKVLSDRLAGMTGRGLVARTEVNLYPREVSYSLTDRGEGLRGILSDLYDWAVAMADADRAAGITERPAEGAAPRPAGSPAGRLAS